jgi:hypothetical protein
MKANYKKRHIISGRDLKEINAYFADGYRQWLETSGVKEDEFLAKANSTDFKLLKSEFGNQISISLVFEGLPFGLPILSPPGEQSKFCKENIAFLLMHIAQKLDKVKGGDYFGKTVQEFARKELLTKYNIGGEYQ